MSFLEKNTERLIPNTNVTKMKFTIEYKIKLEMLYILLR